MSFGAPEAHSAKYTHHMTYLVAKRFIGQAMAHGPFTAPAKAADKNSYLCPPDKPRSLFAEAQTIKTKL